MRILVIGGSGLIGAPVVDRLRERGHEATSVARTPAPGVDRTFDLAAASVADLREALKGHDGVVYAARSDEQRPLPKPIHPVFRRDLVDPVVRLFTAAREEGLSRGVVMGSYYTYFDRLHPQWRLADRHVYIRCRREQASEARSAAGPGLPIAVLELPFVFGRVGDRLPNWSGPLDRWARSRTPLLAPPGGTAVTTARNVAEVAVDALERAAGDDIPVADENLTWAEMVGRIADAVGRPRRVRRLPGAVLRASLRIAGGLQAAVGKEAGLNPSGLSGILLAPLFVEPPSGRSIEPALRETFPPKVSEA